MKKSKRTKNQGYLVIRIVRPAQEHYYCSSALILDKIRFQIFSRCRSWNDSKVSFHAMQGYFCDLKMF